MQYASSPGPLHSPCCEHQCGEHPASTPKAKAARSSRVRANITFYQVFDEGVQVYGATACLECGGFVAVTQWVCRAGWKALKRNFLKNSKGNRVSSGPSPDLVINIKTQSQQIMGLLVSKFMDRFTGLQEKRILLLGLDAAGMGPILSFSRSAWSCATCSSLEVLVIHLTRTALRPPPSRTGKTTLLYNIKLAECVHSVPTVGFNVEVSAVCARQCVEGARSLGLGFHTISRISTDCARSTATS